MMTKFKVQGSKFKVNRGFTLIELMVVLSITAVLGTLGVAGFTTYNQTQVLQTSANEVATMLNLAKSRAQSQIKPFGVCSSGTLEGYNVVILEHKKYTLYLRCSDIDIKISGQDKILPQNLKFFSSGYFFFFPVQTGGVQSPGKIIITHSDSGQIKTITVNPLGGVVIQ